jgi:hypothetical protein
MADERQIAARGHPGHPLAAQGRLADPRFTRDQQHAAMPRCGRIEGGA